MVLIFSFMALNVLSAEPPPPAKRAIVIDKAKKMLVLLKEGKAVAQFPAAFGIDPDSDKYKALDAATPEGLYLITSKNYRTRFHRFMGISYPNLADAIKGLVDGVIGLDEYKRIRKSFKESRQPPSDTGLGGWIGLHGGGIFRSFDNTKETDWTEGCIALNNGDVEKVFNFCSPGDPVIIFNGRRNLYDLIRPFACASEMDRDGTPICPGGVCTYGIEIPTSLGRILLTLKEGKAYGKSLHLRVDQDGTQQNPLLMITDRNGDGHISGIDSISGPAADEKSPDATYNLVREAVIRALYQGECGNSSPSP